jgi:O-antigen/teichoic acid export membrane protein
MEKPRDAEESWKEPGFHRPLAGLLFNLVFIFVAAGFGILISIYLMPNVIYPFPEALGFEDLTNQFFVIYFVILDLGLGAAIQRFVAAENVKDPHQAVKYIQFFIWYQMISGLVQITAIMIWVLYFMPGTDLVYASWFFLMYSTIQYPGMLWVFRGSLEAFQRLDRANILNIINIQVFQNICRVICILSGRWVGRNNPIIGELMGATLGSITGKIFSEFISAYLGAHWLSPILKQINPEFSVGTLFLVQFDKEIVKKCLSFGLKVLVPGLIGPAANFIVINMIIRFLPNYSTILGLFAFGEMLAHLVATITFPGISSSISEAYLNGKYKLTQHYIQQYFRWSAIISCFMIGMLFSGALLIGIIAGEQFSLTTPIIQNFLFFKMISVFASIMDASFVGVGKPEYNVILIGAEQATRIFVLWLLLVPFPSSWLALVYSVGLGWVVKWIVGFILFNKKVLPININIWQTFVASILAAIVEALGVFLVIHFAYSAFASLIGAIPAAVILIIIGIFVGPFLIFFPFYSFFGGWDESSLETLQKAYHMAGPSKFIVNGMINLSLKFAHISPLHNRFKSDISGVKEDIVALMEIHKNNLESRLAK